MSDTRTPGSSGQNADSSTPIDVPVVVEELRALRRDFDQNLRQLNRAVDRLEGKLRALGVGPQGGDSPDARLKPPPALALRSDGRVLLSIAHVAADVDVSTRERWEGVVLTDEEVGEVRHRVSGACDEAAGHLVGQVLAEGANPERDPDEGGA